ncbi:MAG: glycosyl hydrolase, partial [Acidobacteriota bacterium]|nr:glycosyl hydrolase [Acidobacteriota bacterium]
MKMNRRDFLVTSSAAGLITQTGIPAFAGTGEKSFPKDRKVSVFTTAKDTEYRISPTGSLEFKPLPQPLETQFCVFVEPKRTFQTFLGIGSALTDSSAETYAKIPKKKQEEFLKAFFDKKKGIGYTLARTNIHSCDFSSASYTYVDEGDGDLKTFDIKHDRHYRIPFIKKAIRAAGGNLTMYASPWSPPAFMKTTNTMLKGGKLKPEFAQSWANYFVRFITAYEKEGIPMWGLTIQNEPMATQTWESCIYTAEEERDFLKNHLGPTLAKAGLGDKKIIVWDHNRDLIYQRVNTILSDPDAAKYVWGVGFHWYEPWTGGEMMFDNVKLVNQTFQDKQLIFTEGCVDSFDASRLESWNLGERYGYSMINDFNSGTVAWTDWNILLDETGGPNHVGNFCFAPVHADTAKGELIYTNSYYYIGHFSKFIRPGAKKIACAPSRSALLATAFQNPDGTLAVVVMNKGEKEIDFYLWIDGQAAEVRIPPRS